MLRSEVNRMKNQNGEARMPARQETLLLHREMGGIVPVLCGSEMCEPGQCNGPTRREYYLLHYVMEGRGRFTIGERQYELKKGQMFVIRPGEVVRYQADDQHPWTVVWIGFEAHRLSQDDSFILNRQDVFTVPECRSIFREMAECTKLTASLEIRLCGKICELLAMLWDRCEDSDTAAADYIGRAKNYIHTNYAGDITVQGIARSLGLSRSYFSAVFSRETGVSPQEYLVDYRLRKAAEMIRQYGLRPGEAATACGYTDVFTFSKMFKKKFGVPPGKYHEAGEG